MKKPTNFRTLLLVIGLGFFLSTTAVSQTLSSDLKIDEFDIKTEDTETFRSKAVKFLTNLDSYENGITGHLNLSTNHPLGVELLRLAGKERSKRLVLLRPGFVSRNRAVNIEFWLVMKGSEGPFPIFAYDCDCPTSSVVVKEKLDGSETEITFTAEVTGGEKITYAWSVTGAKIISGQGTAKITVKPEPGSDVVAEVEWRGPEACSCRGNLAFTSKFGEREL